MKHLIILFILFTAHLLNAQCNKIDINGVELQYVGNGCSYNLKIDALSLGGNPSIEPRYRCGREGLVNTMNCINLGDNVEFVTEVFTCPCDQSVYIWIIGYASANCNGDTCIAYTSQNLALKDKEKEEVEKIKKTILYANHKFLINNDNITQVELFNSAGQIVFAQKVKEKIIPLPYLIKGIYFARFSVTYRDPVTIKIFY